MSRLRKQLYGEFVTLEDILIGGIQRGRITAEETSGAFQQYSAVYVRYKRVSEDLQAKARVWHDLEPLIQLDNELTECTRNYQHVQAMVMTYLQSIRAEQSNYRIAQAVSHGEDYMSTTARKEDSHTTSHTVIHKPDYEQTQAKRTASRLHIPSDTEYSQEDRDQTYVKRTDITRDYSLPKPRTKDLRKEIDIVVSELERTYIEARRRQNEIHQRDEERRSPSPTERQGASETEKGAARSGDKEEPSRLQSPQRHSTPKEEARADMKGSWDKGSRYYSLEDNGDLESVYSQYSMRSTDSVASEEHRRAPAHLSAIPKSTEGRDPGVGGARRADSPERQRGARSPERQRDARSPERRRGARSPERQRDARSPERRRGARSPEWRRDAHSLERQRGVRSPERRRGAHSPEWRRDVHSPERRQRDTFSSEYRRRSRERPSDTLEERLQRLERESRRKEPDSFREDSAYERRSRHVGYDSERHLEKLQVPTFRGDPASFGTFWGSFSRVVDGRQDIPMDIKFLRLSQALKDDARMVLDGLVCSAPCYVMLKDRLLRKFGGEEKQLTLRMNQIKRLKPIREDHPEELERLADQLESLVAMMHQAGLTSELGTGFLFLTIKEKLPKAMLMRYARWASEHGLQKDADTLKIFVAEEAMYAMEAAEVHFVPTTAGASTGRRDRGRGRDGDRDKKKEVPVSTMTTSEGTGSRPPPSKVKKCRICSGPHWIPDCEQFKALDVAERWARVRQMYVCFKCLGSAHRAMECKWGKGCGVGSCTRRHHRLLHENREEGAVRATSSGTEGSRPAPSPAASKSHAGSKPASLSGKGDSGKLVAMVAQTPSREMVSLRTVTVQLRCAGRKLRVNAMLDDGSMRTFVSKRVTDYLNVEGEDYVTRISGIGGQMQRNEGKLVVMDLWTDAGARLGPLQAITMESVTGGYKPVDWQAAKRQWPHLESVPFPPISQMYDIDLLIGNDAPTLHYPEETIKGGPGEPWARLTPLGWTCVGTVNPQKEEDRRPHVVLCAHEDIRLSDAVVRYWEVEEPPPGEALKPEERAAQEKVRATCRRVDGRYEVGVPWREPRPQIPSTYYAAVKRLEHTERKLLREPAVAELYLDTLEKYEKKGYIKFVREGDQPEEEGEMIIPHFPVTKMDRATTKCRVVFDAAARVRGLSLNDMILPTPSLLNDLVAVLTRFRRNPVAIGCDISEMYLQIRLVPEDRKLHRFLWRQLRTDQTPKVYEFWSAMFGNAASPYMALESSQQNAEEVASAEPRAAESVRASTYMDDTLDSVNDDEEAMRLYGALKGLWARAGMSARKWFSSSATVMASIPPEDRALNVEFNCDTTMTTKTLGVSWEAATDCFTFRVHHRVNNKKWTKRSFLSKVATLFDPLGLVAPVVIAARVVLQDMWRCDTDWDEDVPEALQDVATRWVEELPQLENFYVPRALQERTQVSGRQLHIFCDASTVAYGAVAYVRTWDEEGAVEVRLCLARGKVTPLQPVSIPRLELTAAVLAVKLMEKIRASLELHRTDCWLWSDSTDVLYWIKGCGKCYKPYVANRVGVIQRDTEPSRWRYVPTDVNPADKVSRGMTGSEFIENELWLHGPDFLLRAEEDWPENKVGTVPQSPERRANTMSFVTAQQSDPSPSDDEQEPTRLGPERYSDWGRLCRVTAYVMCFLRACNGEGKRSATLALEAEEIHDAEVYHIMCAQRRKFPAEWKALHAGKPVGDTSKLARLRPTFDVEGQMRIDGRLKEASPMTWAARNPVILPRRSDVTRLIVKMCHEKALHAGTNRVLAEVAGNYWIISAREAIIEWARACAECRRRLAQPATQLMAPLPDFRLRKTLRAFENASVDYAGPMYTKQGRGRVPQKRYLCVFGCLSTRAIHLEVASSMDTSAFLNAFARMSARRGVPTEMWSDNGTNFVGGNREFQELKAMLSAEKVQQYAGNQGIRWHFNPPGAPHFNGVHEILVKAAKRALNVVLGNAMVTDEELGTAATTIEGVINSRPLTYDTADAQDLRPITPNHFLHGRAGGYFAPQSVDEEDYDVRRRWRYVQDIVRQFWERWVKEWLPSLHPRSKWTKLRKDLKPGDVVLLISPDSPRGRWPLGRVEKVFPGTDGLVRAIDVKVNGQTYRRPVVKVCPLEL